MTANPCMLSNEDRSAPLCAPLAVRVREVFNQPPFVSPNAFVPHWTSYRMDDAIAYMDGAMAAQDELRGFVSILDVSSLLPHRISRG